MSATGNKRSAESLEQDSKIPRHAETPPAGVLPSSLSHIMLISVHSFSLFLPGFISVVIPYEKDKLFLHPGTTLGTLLRLYPHREILLLFSTSKTKTKHMPLEITKARRESNKSTGLAKRITSTTSSFLFSLYILHLLCCCFFISSYFFQYFVLPQTQTKHRSCFAFKMQSVTSS